MQGRTLIRRIAAVLLAIAGLAAATPAAEAATCTKTWAGAGGEQPWEVAENWSPAGVPGAGDHVCVPDSVQPLTVVHSAGTTGVRTITSSETIRVAFGSVLELTDATEPSTTSGLELEHSTVGGAGTLTSTVTSIVAGSMRDSGRLVVPVGGALDIQEGLTLADDRDLSVAGSATLASGNLALADSRLRVSGSFDLVSEEFGLYDAATHTPEGAVLEVASGGVVRKSSGDAVGQIHVPVLNAGLISASSGTLWLTGGTVEPAIGALTASGSGRVDLIGAYALGAGAVVDGPIDVYGTLEATVASTLTGAVRVFGTLTGAGDITIADELRVESGSIAGSGELVVPPGATLEIVQGLTLAGERDLSVAGSATLASGNLALADSRLRVSGSFDLGSEDFGLYDGASHTPEPPVLEVASGGVVRKSSGDAIGQIHVPLRNAGLISVSSGTLWLTGSTAEPAVGALTATGSGRVDVSGAYALGTGAVVDGPIDVYGTLDATVASTLTGAVKLFGTLTGAGDITIADTLRAESGSIGGSGELVVPVGSALEIVQGLNVADERDLSVAGSATILSGNLALADSRLRVSGTVELSSEDFGIYDAASHTAAPPLLDVVAGGTVRKGSGDASGQIHVPVRNAGLISVSSGVLWLTGSTAEPAVGALTATGSGRLELSGTYALGAGAAVDGPMNVYGTLDATAASTLTGAVTLFGTLTGAGDLTIAGSLDAVSATMTGGGSTVVAPAATAEITGSLSLTGRTLRNRGTLTWSDGSIMVVDGAMLDNRGLFLANAEGFGIWTFDEGEVYNGGTLRKAVGTGTTSIHVPFVGAGTIDVRSGRVSFPDRLAQTTSGHVRVELGGAGAAAPVDAWHAKLAGRLTLVPPAGAPVQAGDSFEVVSHGVRDGTFGAVEGSPGAGLAWELAYGPDAVTATAVAAAADLSVATTSLARGRMAIRVANAGPDAADAVTLQAVAPAGASLVSERGTCTGTATMTCDLGALRPGDAASVPLELARGSAAGDVVVTVGARTSDPDAADNRSVVTLPPDEAGASERTASEPALVNRAPRARGERLRAACRRSLLANDHDPDGGALRLVVLRRSRAARRIRIDAATGLVRPAARCRARRGGWVEYLVEDSAGARSAAVRVILPRPPATPR